MWSKPTYLTSPYWNFSRVFDLWKRIPAFYTTMRKVGPEILGKGQIDALIDEEIRDVSILTQKKREMKIR